MSILATKLYVQDGINSPSISSKSNPYCFVEFNLSTVRALMPDANLFAYLEKNAPMAATKNGIVALDSYDDFISIVKPEIERAGLSVQDPLEDINRFNFIKDILNKPGYRPLTDLSERVRNLAPNRAKTALDCIIHVRAGTDVSSDETVYVIRADKHYNIIQEVGSKAVAYHDAAGQLMIAMKSPDFNAVKDRVLGNFEVKATLKKYFGDRDNTFFGVDKTPVLDLVTPSHIDSLKTVVNRNSNSATLLKSVLIKGSATGLGEHLVMKAAAINSNGTEKVMSFAQANVVYRRPTDAEEARYRQSSEYQNHPFITDKSDLRPVASLTPVNSSPMNEKTNRSMDEFVPTNR